ncbi:DNA-binding transcriptional regulator, LysR family [Modicisalibacter muralis]|uniref:DNA-binding transcriptional regulator, LysR family n=1 Tax=Modicisalibacter muralis TaxID=119000 RepID=A0A1G9M6H8_9GAMM|nr:LysR family transcriptional regulator [Halomonas muralis]SDL69826.1 DNA-binding transcriptional regulator, LysR family [Halomonas muralis]
MRDLQALRAFVTVAQQGSVSRAAQMLNLTQPAVSLKLKQFQEHLGFKLFQRHPQGLALTPDGHALLPVAEKALGAVHAFDLAARAMHSTVRGCLRIGTIVDPEFIRLGAFLHRLVEQAPQIETELHHSMSGSVFERVLRRELDVGFFLGPPGLATRAEGGEPAIDILELTLFHYLIIAPAGWASRLARTDWTSLTALPWIVTPPASAHHRLLKAVLAPLGLTAHGVAQVDQESCMLDLVRAGVGLSLARDTVAMQERQERGLVIANGVRLPCTLSFIYRRDCRDEPIVDIARSVLKQVWTT